MKRCNKCEIDKDLSFFYKDKSSKDGHRSNCKECCKAYRDGNKEYMKEYRLENKDKLIEKWKSEYYSNKEPKQIKNKKYYSLNKDLVKKKSSEYYSNNRESKLEYQKKYQEHNKDKRNIYLIERRKNDPLFKLITNIRNLVNNSFSIMNYSKTSRTHEILGCSFEELKLYIESKFEPWMDWNNRGIYSGELNYGWDIDHIIPLSTANNEEDLIRLNHYLNLQPLCSKINRDIKKNNIEYEYI